MNNSNRQLMYIIKSTLSDIIAGFILLIVSIFVFFEKFDIIRNPMFNGALGVLFLYLALTSINSKEYQNNRERLLNIDFNSIIVGISLLIVSILSGLGRFEMVRYFLFPLIPGLLLLIVGIVRAYVKTTDPAVIISRIDPCGIVGGEALILYAILLYMDLTSLAWSPIFPLFVAAALYTALFIDILPQIRANQTGIHNATIWLGQIEDKISNMRREFESIKLTHDDPHLLKSLEHLNAIQNNLNQLKKISNSLTFSTTMQTNPDRFRITDIQQPVMLSQAAEQPASMPAKVSWKVPEKAGKPGMKMDSSELEELVGPKISNQLFYENLQKEFDIHGLANIIREAREMRKSIIAKRKTLD